MLSNKKIAVLGAGSWGSTLAQLLASIGHNVSLWDRSPALIDKLQHTGLFFKPLEQKISEGIQLNKLLSNTLLQTDLAICAIASEGIASLIQRIQQERLILPEVLLNVSKGLDQDSHKTISTLWKENFSTLQVATLSGPNLSVEAAKHKPMRTIIASNNLKQAQSIAEIFTGLPYFKVEISLDLLGLEISGAAKNVIALAAGAWDGLELGASGKGAMFTSALAELADLIMLLGGQKSTAYSVAGIGDLFITCTSYLSRNYRTGYLLAKGKTLTTIQTELQGQVAEGIWTTPLLYKLAKAAGCEFKVCELVYEMLQLDLSLISNRQKLEQTFWDLV